MNDVLTYARFSEALAKLGSIPFFLRHHFMACSLRQIRTSFFCNLDMPRPVHWMSRDAELFGPKMLQEVQCLYDMCHRGSAGPGRERAARMAEYSGI